MKKTLQPPIAKKIPTILEKHGERRTDNYYWLKDRENPEVVAHLEAENNFYKKMTAHTKPLQKSLFEEMKARIKEDDSSVPYLYNGYYYLTKFETGQDYPIYIRREGREDAKDEILFDCNKMAKGKKYFNLTGLSISKDNNLVSFSVDYVGRRIYALQIKNLSTGKILDDKIENVTGESTWADDNEHLFYSRQDSGTLRSDRIYRHIIGQNSDEDVLVFHEKDETFHVSVGKEKSRKYLLITCSSTLTTEYRYALAAKPKSRFKIFQKRKRGLEYSIAYYNNYFYVLTNKDKAENFKLMRTVENKTSSENWEEVIAHREDVLLEGIEIFKDYLVTEEREMGLTKIKIIPWTKDFDSYYLPFKLETYAAYPSVNMDFDTDLLRYSYQSLATPSSVVDFNMKTKKKTVKKEQEVRGGYDKSDYKEERVWAKAKDGTPIPISLVYHKNLKKNGKNPLLLYAYGSYGSSMDAYFSSTRVSLLDRGFIYAIAHVRGGEDLGRQWYENGKLLHKINTFSDFVTCGEFLAASKYTSPEHLYAEGGSAGGLLMGVVANIAPELFNGIIAQVPFVDVVTTMLDDTIPLTTGEYDEWGNPNIKKFYKYMRSYSPYDNVKVQKYPNMYISTGLHDSQVQYWEPAKWVAKLREMRTNDAQLYLDTNMDAGHGGASGRFEALRELAKEFSFLLDLEQIKK